ncbi:MAG: hypothetical protein ACKOAX_11885, partial [Candidatus Kapaibacterium sp.]
MEPPVLLAPAAGSQGNPQDVALVWSRVATASAYRLQLSTSFAFASPVVDTLVSDTTFMASMLLASKRYYWRVQSIDADGPGVYVSRNFTTGGTSGVDAVPFSDAFVAYPLPATDRVQLRWTSAREDADMTTCTIYDLN